MNDPIQDIIKSGQKKIEASKQEAKAREKRKEAYVLVQKEKRNEMAFALIPEVLWPYARVEEPDILTIALAGCATIKRRFRATTSSNFNKDLDDWLTIFESTYFSDTDHSTDFHWKIYDWFSYHGDDGWEAIQSSWKDESTIDLERALAIAAEIGDNRNAVEQEVKEKNEQPESIVSTATKTLLCPLMSDGYCMKDDCAWFIAFKHMNACALKVMAHKAADELPLE